MIVKRLVWMIVLGAMLGCGTSAPQEMFPDMVCRSPNGKRGDKVLPRWKYDRIEGLILKHVPSATEALNFKELMKQVDAEIAADERVRLGKVSWLTETVTLELETRGVLVRVPETNTPLPKNVRRAPNDATKPPAGT